MKTHLMYHDRTEPNPRIPRAPALSPYDRYLTVDPKPRGEWVNASSNLVCRDSAEAEETIRMIREGEDRNDAENALIVNSVVGDCFGKGIAVAVTSEFP